MKRLAIAVAAILAVVGVIAAVGASMPREHEAKVEILLAAETDEVWELISDPDGYPAWRREVRKVEWLSDDTWVEHTGDGDLTLRWTQKQAPTRAVSTIADPDLPFSGSWTFTLESVPGSGTKLLITENGAVDNIFVRFITGVAIDEHQSAERYAKQLAKALGSEAKPQRVRAN